MEQTVSVQCSCAKVWKSMRLAQKFRREFVAARLGMSKSAIDKIEQGKLPVRVSDLFQYCKLLNCSPVWFMQEVVKEQSAPPRIERAVKLGWNFTCKGCSEELEREVKPYSTAPVFLLNGMVRVTRIVFCFIHCYSRLTSLFRFFHRTSFQTLGANRW